MPVRRLVAIAMIVASAATAGPLTPPEHRRPPDQTFLTYPEWFLVFSPAEYARFTRAHPPSEFPFIGHIRQFWRGYDTVWNATRGRYPFNSGYHVMIMVIGGSTTVEYAGRGVYETIFGRLAELTTVHGRTEEEVLGARAAQEYVDFIRVRPWYEFDFVSRLRQLCRTSWWGPDPIRKWERKYALTSEYATKAVYGWMITKATGAAYEKPLSVTAVVVDHLPGASGPALVLLPRYEAFMTAATALAKRGVSFTEIAGNRNLILVSVIEREAAAVPYRVIMTEPILTEPGARRLLVEMPVASLAEALRTFDRPPFTLEHVYDY